MSFLLPLGLLLGLAAIAPLLAHALRRGQAKPLHFPATHLVPSKTSSAKERHKLEDKWLLLLRILMLFCLALLAASPFVQCSRLSLSRTDGASVAATIIIDDSASMRARTKEGSSRFEIAIEDAMDLLDTARPGDSFALVLAGSPARIASPPTTELSSFKETLQAIQPSDRKTDLQGALTLSRALHANRKQSEQSILLLSDLSIENLELDLSDIIVPPGELRAPLSNCALQGATLGGEFVHIEVVCTSADAAQDRTIHIENRNGKILASAVAAQDGAVRIQLTKKQKSNISSADLRAVLSAPANSELDNISEDDSCPVLNAAAHLTVGVRADQAKAGIKTGAGTVLQAAIEALDRDVRVQNLSILPDRGTGLKSFGALLIDDPSGFTPEVRDALSHWVSGGGVGVLFLGPGISHAPLGSDFSPFLLSAPSWSRTDAPGVNAEIPGTLGPLTISWNDLHAKSRAVLNQETNVEIKASWSDGTPFVVERSLARGLLITVTLPASLDRSDLALRPAFLELIDYVISQSAIRRGAQATPVGTPWVVNPGETVTAPDGQQLEKLRRSSVSDLQEGITPEQRQYVEPPLAGRYTIATTSREGNLEASYRYAMRDLREPVLQPLENLKGRSSGKSQARLAKVGISREIALLILILGVLELSFRMFRRQRHA